MTILTRPAPKLLPAELIAAGRLPGKLPPPRKLASPVPAPMPDASAGLLVDLSRISLVPAASAGFLPMAGRFVAGLSDCPKRDLVPDFGLFADCREMQAFRAVAGPLGS